MRRVELLAILSLFIVFILLITNGKTLDVTMVKYYTQVSAQCNIYGYELTDLTEHCLPCHFFAL